MTQSQENTRNFEGGAHWAILLVDKEPTQRLILARLLKRAGYEVDTARNGKEALAKIEIGGFHMMITDWEMPEMDGIALCNALRSIARESYVYTILLSARDTIENVVAGLLAGADDYLTKPVIEPELIARLNTGKRIVTLERSLRAANDENRRLAYAHPLTEVFNRLYLIQQLPRELEYAKRYKRPLSVLICDIDYFKHVNDTHGHSAGGRVLIAAANFLKAQAEAAGGWLVHHGGDEFAIVLPNTALDFASAFTDSVRLALSEQDISVGRADVRITASFGVSGWERAVPRGARADDLLRVADKCVYESKFAGRNRVSVRALPVSVAKP